MRLPTLPVPPALQALSPPHTTQNCKSQARPPNGKLDLNPPRQSEVPPRLLPPPPLMAWLPGRKLRALTATVSPLEATGQPKRGFCPRVIQGSRVQKTRDPPHLREAGCHCWLQDLARPHVAALMLKLPLTGTTCCPLHGTGLRSARLHAYRNMHHTSLSGNCFEWCSFQKQLHQPRVEPLS